MTPRGGGRNLRWWLTQLDYVAGRIFANNLRAGTPIQDFISEFHAVGLELCDDGFQSSNSKMNLFQPPPGPGMELSSIGSDADATGPETNKCKSP